MPLITFYTYPTHPLLHKQHISVSINCAHLHPQYGMQTPEEQLAELKREEEEGEVDVNMQEYKKRRDEARRSPYPSVIVEVQSTPPPDFGTRRDEAAMMEAAAADYPPNQEALLVQFLSNKFFLRIQRRNQRPFLKNNQNFQTDSQPL